MNRVCSGKYNICGKVSIFGRNCLPKSRHSSRIIFHESQEKIAEKPIYSLQLQPSEGVRHGINKLWFSEPEPNDRCDPLRKRWRKMNQVGEKKHEKKNTLSCVCSFVKDKNHPVVELMKSNQSLSAWQCRKVVGACPKWAINLPWKLVQ